MKVLVTGANGNIGTRLVPRRFMSLFALINVYKFLINLKNKFILSKEKGMSLTLYSLVWLKEFIDNQMGNTQPL